MTIPVLPNFNGFSVHKRPTFETTVRSPPSGREVTRFQMPVPLWEFELTYEVLRDQSQNQVKTFLSGFTEFESLSQVFVALGGQFARFYYNDLTDNSRTGQAIGVGNGTNVSFRMMRTIFSGPYAYTQPVGAVNVGASVNVYINGSLQSGSTYGFDSTNRFLVFNTAPTLGAVVTADFAFYYYCRFIDDKLEFDQFDAAIRYALKSLRFRSINTDGLGTAILNNEGTQTTLPIPTSNIVPGPFDFTPFLYWEIQIQVTGTTVGLGAGYSACAGIAGPGFQIANPWELNVNSTGPTMANGIFWQFYRGGSTNIAWGYPGRPDNGPAIGAANDWIGFAIDLQHQKLLIRNSTQAPNLWYGQGYNGVFDITKGFDFGPSGGYPITGPIFLLGGGGWGTALPNPELTLNVSGSFVASVPGGYSPWGIGEWSPSDFAAGVAVGGNTLVMGPIAGGNQPTAFCRSTTSFPAG